MEALNDWRAAIRQHLADRVGQPVNVGELFDRTGALMPLHHATRFWVQHGGQIGAAAHEHMRWCTFSHLLRSMNVRLEPPLRRTPLLKTTMVIAEAATCPECGTGFWSWVGGHSCSPKCAAVGRVRRRRSLNVNLPSEEPSAQPLPSADKLSDLAARIRTEHKAFSGAADRAAAAGQLLAEAKGKVPHRRWRDWLKANCEMSERTAQIYMRVARARNNLGCVNPQHAADSSVRGALRILSKARRDPPPNATLSAPTTESIARHKYAVNFTEEEYRAAEQIAAPRNMTVSDVARQALREWLRIKVPLAAE